MALAAALERPGLVSTLLALSPVPPRREGGGKGLRVFLGHGTFDPLIPVQVAHATRDLMTKLGAKVTYREYPMGHMICAGEIADARNFLANSE
jgi:phospholipase/carboxylesterase